MTKEKDKSSISINLFLTEAITEKVIIILLTSFASFTSGIVYANHQQDKLPSNNTMENSNEMTK